MALTQLRSQESRSETRVFNQRMDIDRTCEACDGTGQVQQGENGLTECYSCEGTGKSHVGEVGNGTHTLDQRLTDTENKVDDCLNKLNDILEKLNE